jgi:hypothetical protein
VVYGKATEAAFLQGLVEMGFPKTKRALFMLLNRFLYAAILITTNLQHPANAKPKIDTKIALGALMMSIGATPSSIYLKTKHCIPQQTTNP